MLTAMSSKTITTPSRNHVKRASASRAATSPATRRSTATASKSSVASSGKSSGVKKLVKAAIVVPLAKRALSKVKTKAGMAVLTGVALAVGAGLVRKYRKAS